MALQVLNPLVACNFADNDMAPSIDFTSTNKIEQGPSNFFEEQIDLTSEIMSFLDVESLLKVCQASKIFPKCLRHDHVITSALSTAAPLQLTSTSLPISPAVSKSMFALDKKKKEPQEQHQQHDAHSDKHDESQNRIVVEQSREYTIMKRLLQVFEHYNSIQTSKPDLMKIAMQNVERPSPMRLLRLVNAKKCEKCNRRLDPCSKGSSAVLPSLTFGKFCCTKCIFS